MPLGGAGASSLRGPLKHVHRATTPFGTNPPGGPSTMGATMPYLTGCSLEDVDNMVVLPYGNVDDTPRQFGWAWAGTNYPGPYTAASVGGLTVALNGGTIVDTTGLIGGGITTTTAATAAAQLSIVSAANMAAGQGKRLWFETRIRPGAQLGTTAYLLGWIDVLPADITAALTTQNVIAFLKTYAGTDMNFVVGNATGQTTITNVCAASGQVAATVLANGVDISLGILCDASMTAGGVFQKGAISCFVNGRFAGQVASTDGHTPLPANPMRYALVSQGNSAAGATIYRQSLCQAEF